MAHRTLWPSAEKSFNVIILAMVLFLWGMVIVHARRGKGKICRGFAGVPDGPFNLTPKATPEAGGVVGAGSASPSGDSPTPALAPVFADFGGRGVREPGVHALGKVFRGAVSKRL